MYDANPRTHLKRARELVAAVQRDDYTKLRYAALDVRLAVETTLQEILSSCYSTYDVEFEKLWRARSFIDSIRKQQPDFDLKNKLVPIVLKKNKKIADYPAMDLGRLSAIHKDLGAHLHHVNRYDTTKSGSRTANLAKLLDDAISYLSVLLRYPRCWVEFHEGDQRLFEKVVQKKLPLDDFIRHIGTGRLKNFTIIDVPHPQEIA